MKHWLEFCWGKWKNHAQTYYELLIFTFVWKIFLKTQFVHKMSYNKKVKYVLQIFNNLVLVIYVVLKWNIKHFHRHHDTAISIELLLVCCVKKWIQTLSLRLQQWTLSGPVQMLLPLRSHMLHNHYSACVDEEPIWPECPSSNFLGVEEMLQGLKLHGTDWVECIAVDIVDCTSRSRFKQCHCPVVVPKVQRPNHIVM